MKEGGKLFHSLIKLWVENLRGNVGPRKGFFSRWEGGKSLFTFHRTFLSWNSR